MLKRLIIILSVFLHVGIASADNHNDDFIITYYESEQVPLMIELIRKSYIDIGINPTFVSYPVKRGLNMLKNGQTDADVVRIQAVIEPFDNILVIPTTLVEGDVLLLCNKNIPKCTEEILYDSKQKVASAIYDLDSVIAKNNKDYKAEFIRAQDPLRVVQLMQRGRLKYGLYSVIKGTVPSELSGNFNYTRVMGVNAVHALNKRHQNIAQDLDRAIANNIKSLRVPKSEQQTPANSSQSVPNYSR